MNPSDGQPDDGGFLARWSRRKRAVRERRDEAVETADAPVTADAVAAGEDGVDEDALSDGELLERYELPDPETLTAADDVRAFMRSGVPTRLRNMALRRLWRLDPVLANLDGLVEYNDDYTDAATVIPNLKTLYQVGRGGAAYLQDEADRLAAEREAQGLPPKAVYDRSDGTADGTADGALEGAEEGASEPAEVEPWSPPAQDAPPAPRRRHMVFATRDEDDSA